MKHGLKTSRVRRHLTYANVIATMALFIALGGTSYAALALPKNSVGSRQIRSGAVGASELKTGAVRGVALGYHNTDPLFYGRFRGVGGYDVPQLRVTYTK